MKPDNLKGMALCRRASDPLAPGAVLGFRCQTCGQPLQVTSSGAALIRSGELLPLCHGCGVQMAERLKAAGEELELQATPVALAQTRNSARDQARWAWFQAQGEGVHCAHCGALVDMTRASEHVCEGKA